MYKVDLHTHSIISHDGGVTKNQYKKILEKGILDCIAITDHNQISFAKSLHEELGDKIIIGEEIKTLDGEIIGLFLEKTIKPGLSAEETVAEIKNQDGLVYIPHPFESARSSLQLEALNKIIGDVDILEVFNGRGRWRGREKNAEDFAYSNDVASASSSDAHCVWGLGLTFSTVENISNKEKLVKFLKSGTLQKKHAPFYSLLCPSVNNIKNKFFLNKHYDK